MQAIRNHIASIGTGLLLVGVCCYWWHVVPAIFDEVFEHVSKLETDFNLPHGSARVVAYLLATLVLFALVFEWRHVLLKVFNAVWRNSVARQMVAVLAIFFVGGFIGYKIQTPATKPPVVSTPQELPQQENSEKGQQKELQTTVSSGGSSNGRSTSNEPTVAPSAPLPPVFVVVPLPRERDACRLQVEEDYNKFLYEKCDKKTRSNPPLTGTGPWIKYDKPLDIIPHLRKEGSGDRRFYRQK